MPASRIFMSRPPRPHALQLSSPSPRVATLPAPCPLHLAPASSSLLDPCPSAALPARPAAAQSVAGKVRRCNFIINIIRNHHYQLEHCRAAQLRAIIYNRHRNMSRGGSVLLSFVCVFSSPSCSCYCFSFIANANSRLPSVPPRSMAPGGHWHFLGTGDTLCFFPCSALTVLVSYADGPPRTGRRPRRLHR